jgi:hypothetical protein
LAFVIRRDVRQRADCTSGPALEPAGDVADDPVAEGAKVGHPAGPRDVHRAALAETLDEHLLHGVVQIVAQRRAAPAGGQVRAYGAEVAAGQLLAVGRAAGRGGADHGPAGGFGGGHADSFVHRGSAWSVGPSGSAGLSNAPITPASRESARTEGMFVVLFGSCGSFMVGTPPSGAEHSPDSTETASTFVALQTSLASGIALGDGGQQACDVTHRPSLKDR